MSLGTLLTTLSRQLGRRLAPRGDRPRQLARPRLEALEDRTVPSTVQGLQTATPPTVPGGGGLNATAVIASNDAWAVGSFNPPGSTLTQPLAEHFNGTSWSVVKTPTVNGGEFLAVSGDSSNDVWAVGTNGGVSPNTPLIEHWNGTSWSVVPGAALPAGGFLNSVDALSANNVWAVGQSGGHNLIEHFDGTSWSVVSAPAPRNSDLFSVSGTGPNDVWAVGSAGRSDSRVQILHWDGTSWSTVTAPNPSPFANTLLSVTAIAPNNATAVGFTTSGALIEHWDGTSWSVVNSPNSGAIQLYGVSGSSANNVWAVGTSSDATGLHAVTEHFDGTSWSIVPTPSSSQDQKLVGVGTDSAGDVTAVGVTGLGQATSGQLILQS
jgi:hypothetical protein